MKHISFSVHNASQWRKQNDANPLPYASFPGFRQNRQFSKTALSVFLLRKLIVEWWEVVIKEGTSILHQIFKFRGGANSWGSRIHQNKNWYYLGHFQTSKVELFVKVAFGYKPLTFFVKSSKLDVWLLR